MCAFTYHLLAGTEHKRIDSLLRRGDVVYDVFAGVGPFAVPAGRKRCIVFANDLNPESYKWMQHNITLNKIKSEMHTFNLDGRDFIKEHIKRDMIKRWQQSPDEIDNAYAMHIIMNLPALAVEFLDAFRGLFCDIPKDSIQNTILPRVYCYAFMYGENNVSSEMYATKGADLQADLKERVEGVLGQPLEEGYNMRLVRNVAPNKDMLCASFTLTEDILFEQVHHNKQETMNNTAGKAVTSSCW